MPSRLLLAGKLFSFLLSEVLLLLLLLLLLLQARVHTILPCRNSRPSMRVCESVCASQHVRAVCLASEISSLRL